VQQALADDMAIVWSDVEPDAVLDLTLGMDLTTYDAATCGWRVTSRRSS
jgi:hypothetical protein